MADNKTAMNMPPDVEARIRALPGNGTCCDCNNIKPQWASVTYGALVCLECSGQHRALGVHLSFVRSVQMDSWTPKQIQAMERSGGNASLVEYLSSRGIEKGMSIATKYNTKQAAYYKERLSRWLEGKTEPPPDPGRYDPVSGGGDAQGAEPLPGETVEQYNLRQARLKEAARERLRAKFGDKGLGGVGSDPMPGNDGMDLGSLGGGAVRLVGGAVGGVVGGVGSFLRNNVIENENLHSTLRGTVGSVSDTATGAWSSIRRSLGEGELVGNIRRGATAEDGALAKGIGWTVGAVGGILEKASQGIGDLVSDGDGGGGQPQAPRCTKGHMLRTQVAQDVRCSVCHALGTRYGCSQGCNYDICTKCFEKPQGQQKGGMNFDDDEWSNWDNAPQKAPPPVPTSDDMNRMAKDLGMKLDASKAAAPNDTAADAARPRAVTEPVPTQQASPDASPTKLGGASPAKPKEKAGLPKDDDFFGEFGL